MSYKDKYSQQQLIGRGQYGKVYLVVSQNHQLMVAKKVQLTGMTTNELQSTKIQVQIHRKLSHPNIIKFYESFIEDNVLIMIMEYCQFGDLSIYIKQRKQNGGELLDEKIIMNWFMQLIFGLNYLHENKILHRDLKTSNIFVNSDGRLKLGDFGIAKLVQHTQQIAFTMVGTPFYLSPQICQNKGYTMKSDVWSLGCILYELCTLQRAFQGTNVLSLANKIVNEQVKDISPKYSKQLNQLIKWMLEKKQSSRPNVKDILSSKIVNQYSNKFTKSDRAIEEKKKYQIRQTTSSLSNYQECKLTKISIDDTIKISPNKKLSKAQSLRQKCINKLGKEVFEDVYRIMREMKEYDQSQQQIDKYIRQKYGKVQAINAMNVAQLIYMEDYK